MLKKMMLLASMALAAIAFAVPASASALEWTDEGSSFSGEIGDTITGFIAFGNPVAGQTKFGCEAHAEIDFIGGGTTATLTSFEPTTGTCVGEGSFTGCKLVEHQTTIPSGTRIHILGTNTMTLTTPAGEPIVLHNVYDTGCAIEKSTLTVTHLHMSTPTVAQGNTNSSLTDVTVSGEAQSHTWIRGLGEITQTVGVFGTMGTATDTITIS